MRTFPAKVRAAAVIGLALGFASARASTYTVLHNFDSPPENLRGLAIDTSGNLYGTSANGGLFGFGAVYRINKDGTGLTVLHSFGYGALSDGVNPGGSLVVIGSDIFGTTILGGSGGGLGTVFTLKTDGNDFSVLHSFTGSLNGAVLDTSLISDGSTNLYGTTAAGGVNGLGTVFTLKTDGTDFSILHSFAGGTGDGATPQAPLTLDDAGNLYGTTSVGGQLGYGVAFSITTGGAGFAVLHSFDVSTFSPLALTLDGAGNLYGAAPGAVFKMKTDGSGFSVLHSFSGGTNDGNGAQTALALSGSTLFGTTMGGGAAGRGTVFSLKVTGTGFVILHSFTGNSTDGAFPGGSFISDGTGGFLGTSQFGPEGGSGALFSIKSDGTGFSLLKSFNSPNGTHPYGAVIRDGAGFLYGTCAKGGTLGYGTVFRVKTDGTGFTVLHSFSGGSTDGAVPRGPLVLDGLGYLYGTTAGATTFGTVFRMRTNGTGFSVLRTFSIQDAVNPWLLLDNAGFLYGTTHTGGTKGLGTIFRLNQDGTSFTTLHSFSGGVSDGAEPLSPLVLLGSDYLYGTTAAAGGAGGGTVFTVNTSGGGFSLLHSFGVGIATDGIRATNSLISDQGFLYGTTVSGGANGDGAIFRIAPGGESYSLAYSLGLPGGSLFLVPDELGNLLGARSAVFGTGGNDGALLTFPAGGGDPSNVHQFSGSPGDGSNPTAPVLRDGFENGTLFGTTADGGSTGGGTIFKITAEVVGASLPAPLINSPAEGDAFSTSRVSFNWGPVNGAAGYDLLVIDDSSGETLYSGDLTGLGTTSISVDLPNGGMTFGVRACSGGFADANCGPFATVDFTINVLPPTRSSSKFYTLTPCRIADTRNAAGPYGGPALSAGISRVFKLVGQCGIPTGAKAASVNVTVVTPTDPGELKLNPTGADPQLATAISFPAGRVLANNAMVFLGSDGAMSVFDAQDTGSTHFIIDVNGYFK